MKGRAAKVIAAERVRDLTPADLALLESERGVSSRPLVRLRDRHHSAARCIANGMSNPETSSITGYDTAYLSVLKSDPSFKELVAHYQTCADAAQADFLTRATGLSLTAMNNLQEMLENDAEPLAPGMQLEIAKFAADRIGHAPVQKNVNVNVNAELGSRLDAARRRLRDVTPAPEAPATDSLRLAATSSLPSVEAIEAESGDVVATSPLDDLDDAIDVVCVEVAKGE